MNLIGTSLGQGLLTEPLIIYCVMSPMIFEQLGVVNHMAPLAYLDGGSGSLIFQMLIATSVTAIYAVKTRWQNLVAAFSKLRHRGSNPSDQ